MGTLTRDTVKIIFGPAAVLAINFVLSHFTDVYSAVTWFDNIMHYAGGFSIAITAMIILRVARRRNYVGDVHLLRQILFVLSFTALAAILWEFYEFLDGELFNTALQLSRSDTLSDIFFGLVGGMSGALGMLFANLRHKFPLKRVDR